MLAPPVEPGAAAPGSLDHRRDLTSAAGDDPLDSGIGSLVMANFDALPMQAILDPGQLGPGGLELVLSLPLERRMRLGDEWREPERDVAAARVFPQDGFDLPDQLRQLLEILLVLGGMADHEVKLHAGPARRHRAIHRRENVFF